MSDTPLSTGQASILQNAMNSAVQFRTYRKGAKEQSAFDSNRLRKTTFYGKMSIQKHRKGGRKYDLYDR